MHLLSDKRVIEILLHRARERMPKVALKPKTHSWLMCFINVLFNVFAKEKDWFVNRFWTTIGYTIYWPANKTRAELKSWGVLAHELVHCIQRKRWGLLFPLLYLFPLSLGALIILTCWLPVFWASGCHLDIWIPCWFAVGALLFIPWIPDPWRTRWELQGYAISMYAWYLRYEFIDEQYIDYASRHFSGMKYYVMEPRRQKIVNELKSLATSIQAGAPNWLTANPNTAPVVKWLNEGVGK